MKTTDPAALEAETCKTCHYGQEGHRAFCAWPDAGDEEPCGNWRPVEVCPDKAELASLRRELAAARGANLVLDERAAGLVRALENAIFNFRNETCGHGSQCVLGKGCNNDVCCVHAWVAALDKYREGME